MSAFAFWWEASRRAPQAAETRALFFCRHSTTRLLPGFTSGQNCLMSSAQTSSARATSSAAHPSPGTTSASHESTTTDMQPSSGSLLGAGAHRATCLYDHPMVIDMLKSLFTPPSGGRLS